MKISGRCARFPLSWGERAGVRARFSSELIFGVGGSVPNPKSEMDRASSRRLLQIKELLELFSGGPTFTMALLPGSAAIDQGSSARLAGLRLVQAEEALRLVERHGDLKPGIVCCQRFDGGLPVCQAQARRGFKNETSGRERPGNGDRGVAAHNGEAIAGGIA